MDNDKLSIEWVPTDRLFCNPANPRHNDDAVPHVAGSLRRFGWQQPIVAGVGGVGRQSEVAATSPAGAFYFPGWSFLFPTARPKMDNFSLRSRSNP